MGNDRQAPKADFRDERIELLNLQISNLTASLEAARKEYKRLFWQVAGGALVGLVALSYSPGFSLMTDGSLNDLLNSERLKGVKEESVSMFNENLETTFLCSTAKMWEEDRLWPSIVSAFESEYDPFQMSEYCFDWDGSESSLNDPVVD